jgi:hypothetical protein
MAVDLQKERLLDLTLLDKLSSPLDNSKLGTE